MHCSIPKGKRKGVYLQILLIVKGRCDGIILALAFALSDRTRSFFRENISYRTIYTFTFNTYPGIMESEMLDSVMVEGKR